MWALITAALQGLAAIPKILDFLSSLNIAARLEVIEKNQQALKAGFDQLQAAKTPEEVQGAAHAVAAAWGKHSG